LPLPAKPINAIDFGIMGYPPVLGGIILQSPGTLSTRGLAAAKNPV